MALNAQQIRDKFQIYGNEANKLLGEGQFAIENIIQRRDVWKIILQALELEEAGNSQSEVILWFRSIFTYALSYPKKIEEISENTHAQLYGYSEGKTHLLPSTEAGKQLIFDGIIRNIGINQNTDVKNIPTILQEQIPAIKKLIKAMKDSSKKILFVGPHMNEADYAHFLSILYEYCDTETEEAISSKFWIIAAQVVGQDLGKIFYGSGTNIAFMAREQDKSERIPFPIRYTAKTYQELRSMQHCHAGVHPSGARLRLLNNPDFQENPWGNFPGIAKHGGFTHIQPLWFDFSGHNVAIGPDSSSNQPFLKAGESMIVLGEMKVAENCTLQTVPIIQEEVYQLYQSLPQNYKDFLIEQRRHQIQRELTYYQVLKDIGADLNDASGNIHPYFQALETYNS